MSRDECLRQIDQSAACIDPDDDRLSRWVSNNARNHRVRLAEDLSMLQEHARHESKILECGSIPPLLTLAAYRMGYDIHGVDIARERFSTAIATYNPDIRKVDFEREPVPFPNETFDLVLFNRGVRTPAD